MEKLNDISKGQKLALGLMVLSSLFLIANWFFLVVVDFEELFVKFNPIEIYWTKLTYALLSSALLAILGIFSFAAFIKGGFEHLSAFDENGLRRGLNNGIFGGLVLAFFLAIFDILREEYTGDSMAESIHEFITKLVFTFIMVLICVLIITLQREIKNAHKGFIIILIILIFLTFTLILL